MNISKSGYLNAVYCDRLHWLNRFRPEAYDKGTLDQALLATGREVGALARGLFGAYALVDYDRDHTKMLDRTQAYLAAGEKVICEASFAAEGTFCSVDILKVVGRKEVEIYEVKYSTGVQDHHYTDVAFQVYTLRRCGYRVRNAFLVHINGDYVRNGAIELDKLFTTEELLYYIEDIVALVPYKLKHFEEVLEGGEPPFAACIDCFDCGCFGYCTRDLPHPNVLDVAGMRKDKKLRLYEQGRITFEDVLKYGKPAKTAKTQLKAETRIDRGHIRAFLDTLSYPLYFLDFETVNAAVPLYDGDRPYTQVPFQYSLHVLDAPGGTLRHTAFLGDPAVDPRGALAEQLVRDIPQDACVLAYNRGFERGVIGMLADRFPSLGDRLLNIRDHILDLMAPFQAKDCYLPAMGGSYSIKAVLPALYPDDPTLDYSRLEGVQKGEQASAAFLRMRDCFDEEKETLRRQLSAYCTLDTFAMVRLLDKLKEISR